MAWGVVSAAEVVAGVPEGLRSGGRRAEARAARERRKYRARSESWQIREWARANGHRVAAGGRLPAEVRAAHRDAHPDAES